MLEWQTHCLAAVVCLVLSCLVLGVVCDVCLALVILGVLSSSLQVAFLAAERGEHSSSCELSTAAAAKCSSRPLLLLLACSCCLLAQLPCCCYHSRQQTSLACFKQAEASIGWSPGILCLVVDTDVFSSLEWACASHQVDTRQRLWGRLTVRTDDDSLPEALALLYACSATWLENSSVSNVW